MRIEIFPNPNSNTGRRRWGVVKYVKSLPLKALLAHSRDITNPSPRSLMRISLFLQDSEDPFIERPNGVQRIQSQGRKILTAVLVQLPGSFPAAPSLWQPKLPFWSYIMASLPGGWYRFPVCRGVLRTLLQVREVDRVVSSLGSREPCYLCSGR